MDGIVIGSQAWLEVRRTKISATDLPVIMLQSKWKTPLQLFEEKLTGKEPERNYAMQRGLSLEDDARRAFEQLTGEFVSPKFIVDDWKCASLDGINENGVACELKCPLGRADHEIALRGEVPAHYMPQLQWQMLLADLPWMYYESFIPGDPMIGIPDSVALIKVERNDMMILNMIGKAKEFWDRLQSKTPPESSDRDVGDIPVAFRAKERRAADLMESIKHAEEELDRVKADLIEACNGKKCEGEFLRLTPYETRGNVDYAKIPALKEVNLEEYRKPASIRWRMEAI